MVAIAGRASKTSNKSDFADGTLVREHQVRPVPKASRLRPVSLKEFWRFPRADLGRILARPSRFLGGLPLSF